MIALISIYFIAQIMKTNSRIYKTDILAVSKEFRKELINLN